MKITNKLSFLGDVHGKLDKIPDVGHTIIQVGDMGIGFVCESKEKALSAREDVFFIRGNHDDPDACRKMPNYLGDWGYQKVEKTNIFWFGGAYSIDKNCRTPFKDWWQDEEISYLQSMEAINKYSELKPEIMITHDGPESLFEQSGPMQVISYLGRFLKTRTSSALENMLKIHRPKLWVFGHHHISKDFTINGTRFRCLKELEIETIFINNII